VFDDYTTLTEFWDYENIAESCSFFKSLILYIEVTERR